MAIIGCVGGGAPSGHLDREGCESACRFVETVVAAALGIGLAELRAESRGRAPAALARQTAMYLAHVHFGLSLSAVGRTFGRDRTTVAHACARVEDRRDDPKFERILDLLEAALDRSQSGVLAMEAAS